MRPGLIASLLAALVPWGPALAQDESCAPLSWSVGREIDLFADYLPTVESTQSLPKEGVFSLVLKSTADVIYPVAPERGSDGGYGGIVTIESMPAGRYEIALSDDAWVDAVQDNVRLSTGPTGRVRECRGVRRSVEVEVKGQPLTLQISGAKLARINIALVRIWPFEWKW
jgi:hypothetical protein